ncbi:MAG: carbonic anhydrase [Myxococcales bacterium]|nr:carbonic anhydrase [Myxococcales bacterium]MDP3500627.1 carbonic anhydrase [Myxococcales bacterium]
MVLRQVWRVALATGVIGAVAVGLGVPRVRFLLGGALVSTGLRVQDHLEPYDFIHADAVERPIDVWNEFVAQNELSSSLRAWFPRTPEHPLVAMLVCMDSRLDVGELTGDTRGYYYVIRTAGSLLGAAEQEMLELAVANGVRLIVLTRHTDCAAERAATDAAARARYPELTRGVLEHDLHIKEFLARPVIAAKIDAGELMVKEVLIDTGTEHLIAGVKP